MSLIRIKNLYQSKVALMPNVTVIESGIISIIKVRKKIKYKEVSGWPKLRVVA